jgi:hypothetical protein
MSFPKIFSLPTKTLLLVNSIPSLVGALSDLSVSTVYRTQWANNDNLGYETFISEVNYTKGSIGSGFYIRTDRGLFNNYRNDIGLMLNNTVNRKKIEFKYGLKLNYTRNALSSEENAYRGNISNPGLHPDNQIGFRTREKSHSLNSALGASLATKSVLLSFSLPQLQLLSSEDQVDLIPACLSFAYLKRLQDVSISAQATIFDHLIISTDRQYMNSQLLTAIGLNTKYKMLKMGVEYQLRTKALSSNLLNSVVYKAGFDGEKVSVNYLLDHSKVNSLNDEPNMDLFSHEILAAWHINGRKNNSKTAKIIESLF